MPSAMQATDPRSAQLSIDLRRAWSQETSADPSSWTTANPAWGQCAVTACIVQDELGGEIVCSEAELPDGRRISHYFNLLGTDGNVLDLTREQFPSGTRIPTGVEKQKGFAGTREYILSFTVTRQRYVALRDAFAKVRQHAAARHGIAGGTGQRPAP